jgi:hypothetical protein
MLYESTNMILSVTHIFFIKSYYWNMINIIVLIVISDNSQFLNSQPVSFWSHHSIAKELTQKQFKN